jgi:hypothetical protein
VSNKSPIHQFTPELSTTNNGSRSGNCWPVGGIKQSKIARKSGSVSNNRSLTVGGLLSGARSWRGRHVVGRCTFMRQLSSWLASCSSSSVALAPNSSTLQGTTLLSWKINICELPELYSASQIKIAVMLKFSCGKDRSTAYGTSHRYGKIRRSGKNKTTTIFSSPRLRLTDNPAAEPLYYDDRDDNR